MQESYISSKLADKINMLTKFQMISNGSIDPDGNLKIHDKYITKSQLKEIYPDHVLAPLISQMIDYLAIHSIHVELKVEVDKGKLYYLWRLAKDCQGYIVYPMWRLGIPVWSIAESRKKALEAAIELYIDNMDKIAYMI